MQCTSRAYCGEFWFQYFILSSTQLVFYVIFVAFISSSSARNERTGNRWTETHTHAGNDQRANQTTLTEFTRTQCEHVHWIVFPLCRCRCCVITFPLRQCLHGADACKNGQNRKWILKYLPASGGSASNTCKVFLLAQMRLAQISTINLADHQMTWAHQCEKFKSSNFVSGEIYFHISDR